MKSDPSNEEDLPLRALLSAWKPEAPLPARFKERVWRRIGSAETGPPVSVSLAAVFAHWLTHLLPRPALAAAYVAVLLVLGAGAGWSQARQETARVAGELGARYAQAVDPYQPKPQP